MVTRGREPSGRIVSKEWETTKPDWIEAAKARLEKKKAKNEECAQARH